MRLLGFLTGTVLTGIVVYLTSGGPAIEYPAPADTAAIGSSLRAARARPEPGGGMAAPGLPAADPIPQSGPPEDGAPAEWVIDAESVGETGDLATSDWQSAEQEVPQPSSPDSDAALSRASQAGSAAGDSEWETFFTAFRSQASAGGFARHLQSATGREFRVHKAGPGQYLVSFRISADEDRARRISEIESISGLRLKGGDL